MTATGSGEPEGMTRRRLLSRAAGAAAGSSIAALGPSAALALARPRPPGVVSGQRMWADRAVATYDALQRYFYPNDGTGLYRETHPRSGGHPYSFLWSFSRVLVGTLTLAGIPSGLLAGADYGAAVHDRLRGLGHYWDAGASPPGYDCIVVPPVGRGGVKFYDDNAWIGLALMQHYQMTGRASSLARAAKVLGFVYPGGWDASTYSQYPGGTYWVEQGHGQRNHDRTATSNAPNGELAFHLSKLDPTHRATYAAVGSAIRDWVSTNLYNVHSSGLVYDKVRGNGAIDPTLWTYNQGALVAADVMAYRTTGNSTYLREAESLATAALNHFSQSNYLNHSAAFNAIYFRGLLQLHSVSANTRLQAKILHTMTVYADNVWNHHRVPGNLFSWPTSAPGSFQLIDQGAVLQTFATLAWHAHDYSKLG